MFTPQQIEEHSFVKAVFGGYDMQSVNDFLTPLVEDYTTLYKENAVLKSKLRILVEKLEEYRKQESTMQNTVQAAQQQAKDVLDEAERKAKIVLAQAQQEARHSADSYQDELSAEAKRLEQAKAAASSFISAVEQDIQQHLDLLEKLKGMDLGTAPQAAPQPAVPKPAPQPAPAPQPTPQEEQADDIAEQIEQNLEKLVGSEPAGTPTSTFDPQSTFDTKVMRPLHPESITAKFGDLQFGKNYNPKG